MYGWAGTILDIDLSSGKIEKRPFDIEVGKNFLGGRGINSYLLYEELKPGGDPIGPENVLIFGTGPLGGTMVPSSNRMNVTAKACAYKGLATSNVGGFFGPELKWAGYDHIIFRGKAEKPVYVWIDDDHVELRTAEHLWGKGTGETDRLIREELGDTHIKVGYIGPAGERLVEFSSIIFTLYRAAGQAGLGKVMGSKNLKAVAVRGTNSIEVARPEELRERTCKLIQRIKENPIYEFMSVHGTPGFTMLINEGGLLAVRNVQQSGHWEKIKGISVEELAKFYTKDKACHSCPIHCSHYFEIKEGPYKGEKGAGIEAGCGPWPFGNTLDNADAASLFKCMNLCNYYGMDTMDLGFTLGAVFEWYEKGIITKSDTDGLVLEWGNPEAIIAMIEKIGKREGIGDVIAEGAVHAAEKIGKGAIDYVNHCKGLMLGVDDSRIMKGSALNLATGTVPAHAEEGGPLEMPGYSPFPPEMMIKLYGAPTIDPLSYKKAGATIYYQNICKIMDALEICKFASSWFGQEIGLAEAAELFSSVTGIESNAESMDIVAERITDIERAFGAREGMTGKDDHFHGKLMREPTQTGPYKGQTLDPEKFDVMLEDYYELRGWDKKTGIPTREKLEKVGLKKVADELERMGKIAPSQVKGKAKE